jgi:hypothetical protein
MRVTGLYRARTDTKMTSAAERLAVIAAIPITSLSSILGVNAIVNDSTKLGTADHLVVDRANHLSDPVALGSQTGRVVISRPGGVRKMVAQATAG